MEDIKLKKAIQRSTQFAYQTQTERILLSNKITRSYREKNHQSDVEKRDPIYGLEEDPKTMQKILEAIPSGELSEEMIRVTRQYTSKLEEENDAFECVRPLIEATKIYQEYFSNYPFLETGTMGVIIGWLDIEKAKFPSSFWNYAGLVPPKRKDPHQKETKLSSLQNIPREMASTHNPFVKAKLVGELGKSLLLPKSPWLETYRSYKEKVSAETDRNIRSSNHLHNMSARFTIKEFLKDLHVNWRRIEGLPEPTPYQAK